MNGTWDQPLRDLFALLEEHRILIIMAALLAGAFHLAVSVRIRRRRGEPVGKPTFQDVRFEETWASGRAGWWAGANGCLWITVDPDILHFGPHFPWRILFTRRAWRRMGLEADVPLADIQKVEDRAFRWLAVTYAVAGGESRRVKLKVREPAALKRVLEEGRLTRRWP
jgi:hypothetical protein